MKILKILFSLLALLGLGISIFLTYGHFTPEPIGCFVESGIFSHCDSVLRSEYSTIYNIPISIFGVIFYLLMFIISIFLFLDKKIFIFKKDIKIIIIIMEFFASLFSLYYLYIQFFVLEAACPYCFTSAIATFLMFGISIFLKK